MAVAAKVYEAPDFSKIATYQNAGVVAKLAAELDLTEANASLLFDDVKKFLFLSAIAGTSLRPSRIIDEGWHRFILFTRDYDEFCQSYFGHFIHHQPDVKATDKASAAHASDIAKMYFGDDLSENWKCSTLGADCAPDHDGEPPPADCATNN